MTDLKLNDRVTLPIEWRVVAIDRPIVNGKPGPISSITLSFNDIVFVALNTPARLRVLADLGVRVG